jgi:hypothetical protein
VLKAQDIEIVEACFARPDGWVQLCRPDKPSKNYLQFPGNYWAIQLRGYCQLGENE